MEYKIFLAMLLMLAGGLVGIYLLFVAGRFIAVAVETRSILGPISKRYRIGRWFKRYRYSVDWKDGVLTAIMSSSGGRRVETYTFDFPNGEYSDYESRDNTPLKGIETRDGFHGYRAETPLEEGLKKWRFEGLKFKLSDIFFGPAEILAPPDFS